MDSIPLSEPQPPIDRPSLVNRCMGDAGFACMILGKFRSQLGPMADRIATAVMAGDAASAGKAAHAMKGAAANLSAEALQAAAQIVEAAGAANDLPAVTAGLPALRAEADRCLSHLPKLIAELSAVAA